MFPGVYPKELTTAIQGEEKKQTYTWMFTAVLPKNSQKVEAIYGEGNGNPLQYSCLENLMDRGAW